METTHQSMVKILRQIIDSRGLEYLKTDPHFINAYKDLGGSRKEADELSCLEKIGGRAILLETESVSSETDKQMCFERAVQKLCSETAINTEEDAARICAAFWWAVYRENPPSKYAQWDAYFVEEVSENAPECQIGDFTIAGSTLVRYCGTDAHVDVPLKIRRVGASAFKTNTQLKSVRLPENLTTIDDDAFSNCTALRGIILPKGLRSIGSDAFEGCCLLTDVAFPEGLKRIGEYAFSGCTSLVNVRLPEGVEYIGAHAFDTCVALQTIHLPNSIRKIGTGAFFACSSLASAALPEALESCSDKLFAQSGLKKVTLPGGLKSIGAETFSGCSDLKRILLPPEIVSIGDRAFYSCTSIRKAKLPENIRQLGDAVFSGCSFLEEVSIQSEISCVDLSIFHDCPMLKFISLPDSVQVVVPGEKEMDHTITIVGSPKWLGLHRGFFQSNTGYRPSINKLKPFLCRVFDVTIRFVINYPKWATAAAIMIAYLISRCLTDDFGSAFLTMIGLVLCAAFTGAIACIIIGIAARIIRWVIKIIKTQS